MLLEPAHFEIHGNIAFYVLRGQTMPLLPHAMGVKHMHLQTKVRYTGSHLAHA